MPPRANSTAAARAARNAARNAAASGRSSPEREERAPRSRRSEQEMISEDSVERTSGGTGGGTPPAEPTEGEVGQQQAGNAIVGEDRDRRNNEEGRNEGSSGGGAAVRREDAEATAEAGSGGAAQGVVRMTSEEFERMKKLWSRSARDFVQKNLFPFVVFVNKDEKIEYGSAIQKLVCDRGMVMDVEFQKLFWNEMGGMEVCRNAMATRRTTVCNALRDKIKGTWTR